MYCPQCGSQMADDAAFCSKCGAVAPQRDSVGAPVEIAAEPSRAASNAEPSQAAPNSPAGETSRGCFGSAWDDVKQSPGSMKKFLLMGLILLVPILNFVYSGYVLGWAASLVRGERGPLPDKIVTSENFKRGFYSFVLNLVALLIVGLEASVLGLIPIVGRVASAVLYLFAFSFVNLALIRMALFERLGAGFEVGKIMEAYRRSVGKAFGAAAWPLLIATGVGFVLALAYVLIAMMASGMGVGALGSAVSYAASGSYRLTSVFAQAMMITLVIGIVFEYVILTISAHLACVMMRGGAHYVARFAPEWAQEVPVGADANANANANVASSSGDAPSAGAGAVAEPAAPVPSPAAPQSGALGPGGGVVAAPASVAPAAQAAPAWGGYEDETSVLPEYPEELDTVVQAESESIGQSPVLQEGGQAGPAVSGELLNQAPSFATAEQPPIAQGANRAEIAGSTADQVAVQTSAQELTPAPAVESGSVAGPTSSGSVGSVAAVSVQPASSEARRSTPPVSSAGAAQGASNATIGDNSSTTALGGRAADAPSSGGTAAGLASLQLTRANGDSCVLTNYPTVIGKGTDADLVIGDNSAVSRHHVRILRDGNLFAAEDLGSTNKTFIGDYELPAYTPTLLSDGDVLRLADEVLRVSIG